MVGAGLGEGDGTGAGLAAIDAHLRLGDGFARWLGTSATSATGSWLGVNTFTSIRFMWDSRRPSRGEELPKEASLRAALRVELR